MRTRRHSAVAAALAGALLAFGGCGVSLDDPAGRACDQSHECAGGRVCVAGVCRPPGVDGGSGPDGGAPDATNARDAAPFCPNQPASLALCDDFDDAPLGARWDAGQGIQGATLVVDSADFTSSPNSLLVSSAPWQADSGVGAFALLNQSLSSSNTHVHVEFDLRMDHLGDPGVSLNKAYPMQFRSESYYLRLKVMPSGALSVEQQAGSVLTDFPFEHASDPTQWSHVTFDVSLATPSLIVTQNGVEQINTGKSGPNIDPSTATGSRIVAVGLYWALSTDWRARFDDVTVAAN